MTLPVTVEPLPASYSFGKVVGRIIHLIADTSADADDKPEARPAAGKVRFYPDRTINKTVEANYPAIVLRSTEAVTLDAQGRVVDAEGRDGIWLAVGVYRVQFEISGSPGAIPDFNIVVTSDHIESAPLDLAREIPYTPPTGVAVQTVVIPAGGQPGQMLVRTVEGGFAWRSVVLADDAQVITTADKINDATAIGKSLLRAATASDARSAVGAASQQDLADALANMVTTVAAADITDASATGRAVLKATDPAAARAAIGAGTGSSNLALGTTATTAKRGDYQPTAADISDMTATGRALAMAASQAAARTAIGAGTSSLAVGTAATDAKAGDWKPTAADVSDATATGRSVMTAASQAAARTAIGAGTSSLAVGTAATDAKAGNYQPTAANISDSTATGQALIKATNAAAARTAIGAGVVDSADSSVLQVVKLTQAAYTALATKVATTLYVIVG